MVDTPLYVQKGFGLKKQIQGLLQDDYHSLMVDAVREAGHTMVFGEGQQAVTIRLAQDFGFCYGVDRAVDLAVEGVLFRDAYRQVKQELDALEGDLVDKCNESIARRVSPGAPGALGLEALHAFKDAVATKLA